MKIYFVLAITLCFLTLVITLSQVGATMPSPKPYVNAPVAYHIQDGRTKPAKISALNPDAADVVDLTFTDGSDPALGVKFGTSEGQWSWPVAPTGA